jgi:peroxiredoxin
MRRLLGSLALSTLACRHPASQPALEPGPTRLPILADAYGQADAHPGAISIGERLEALQLPLADGGELELQQLRGAGPVVFAWVGGAEHDSLTGWVHALDRSFAAFDERGATLVFVRPLEREPTLRWATELGLQSPVAADAAAAFARVLDLLADDRPAARIDFAVLIVEPDGRVAYRKLGGRRPELTELLAVLDHTAESLRCCPGACVGEPCERSAE